MYSVISKENSGVKIYRTSDPEFDPYGYVIKVPLQGEYDDKPMLRQNKWISAYVDNESLIAHGVIPGVTGENYKVKF